MSKFESRGEHAPTETTATRRLEWAMQERFKALEETQRMIETTRRAYDASLNTYEAQHPRPKKHSEEWYEAQAEDSDVQLTREEWKNSMKIFQNSVIAVMESQNTEGELIPVQDGSYETKVMFPGRDGKDTEIKSGSARMCEATLAQVIAQTHADISMEGIHNYGFRVPDEAYMGTPVHYEVSGPNDFAYRSSCYVDQGGHVLRSAWQFR